MELNFRVWEPLNKKMYQANFALYLGDADDVQKRFVLPLGNQSLNRAYTIMNLNAVKIMQSTGLTDRLGKEIFESDVVKWGHNINTIGEGMGVIFDGGFDEGIGEITMGPLGIGIGPRKMLWDMEGYLENGIEGNVEELEVIGNIHENPDLLK